mgnify:FL=1
MKLIYVLSVIVLSGCANKSQETHTGDNNSETIVIDSIQAPEKDTNVQLLSFLETPIDLTALKTKYRTTVTTSVTNGKAYYFKPNVRDSIFFTYNLKAEQSQGFALNQLIVLKYGDQKNYFDDSNEILLEMRISNQDKALGKANLVGLTRSEIVQRFG